MSSKYFLLYTLDINILYFFLTTFRTQNEVKFAVGVSAYA